MWSFFVFRIPTANPSGYCLFYDIDTTASGKCLTVYLISPHINYFTVYLISPNDDNMIIGNLVHYWNLPVSLYVCYFITGGGIGA